MKRRDVTTIYSVNLDTGKKETIKKLKNIKKNPKQVLYPVYSREKDTLYYICRKDIFTNGDRAYLGKKRTNPASTST